MDLSTLNKPQLAAVTAENENVLVLAGAGSGKTRVLTHRIAWLCQNQDISPMNILAVTFTNKAAKEMRNRVEQLLGYSTYNMWIGTFHGIAHRLLRYHAAEIGLNKNFTILDQDDQYQVIKRIIRESNLDEKLYAPRYIQGVINNWKDEGHRSADLNAQSKRFDINHIRIYKLYEQRLIANEAIDFADLLLYTYELFKDNETIRQHYQNRFKLILVDEFQDTNKIQYNWLKLLIGSDNSITAVGDDDQSIYGWRGAKVENVQQFTEELNPVNIIRLEQNYRSTQNILDAANAVIQNNPNRMGKTLWTDIAAGEKIDIYDAINERDEAAFIVKQIKKALDINISADKVAILYRSNAQSRVLEEALLTEKIPYKIYGGLRFFDRAEIKDTLAYLRLLESKADNLAFERIINVPARGIGAKSLDKVREYAITHQYPFWQAAKDVIDLKLLTPKPLKALSGFLELIEDISIKVTDLPLGEKVKQVIELSGLVDYFQQDKFEKSAQKIENLQELVTAATDFTAPLDQSNDTDLLQEFLALAVLESGEKQNDKPDEPSVQLMTLHSAKGLEFPYVFISGFEDGLFPSARSIESDSRLAEERRLCYVGMTRAMQKLTITHAKVRHQYGTANYQMPSRFLKEIPKEFINEIKAKSKPQVKSFGFGISPETFLKAKNQNEALFNKGDLVSHPKFGIGVFQKQQGEGDKAELHIDFKGGASTKVLLAKYARLEKL
ncbi:DNA helicase II [Francisellaceae bacterium]|nr:DNA helicase II [Francisellaceae bacterium]